MTSRYRFCKDSGILFRTAFAVDLIVGVTSFAASSIAVNLGAASAAGLGAVSERHPLLFSIVSDKELPIL